MEKIHSIPLTDYLLFTVPVSMQTPNQAATATRQAIPSQSVRAPNAHARLKRYLDMFAASASGVKKAVL